MIGGDSFYRAPIAGPVDDDYLNVDGTLLADGSESRFKATRVILDHGYDGQQGHESGDYSPTGALMGSGAGRCSLLVGMVTHARSRFNVEGAAGTFVGSLADALGSFGLPASTLVSDRDDYDAAAWPLSRAELVESAWYQSRLEYRWRRYLDADSRETAAAVRHLRMLGASAGRRVLDAAAGAFLQSSDRRYGRVAARRLINIDLSHLRVFEEAGARGTSWVLVLEDDAGTASIDLAARALAELIDRIDDRKVQFVSLSTSLTHEQLGVTQLLSEQESLLVADDSRLTILRADRPVTNTVCATLYRTSFATYLASRIRDQGLVPVVPIDWRVNEVLLDMWAVGRLGPESCIWVEPGIFVQRSMHSMG